MNHTLRFPGLALLVVTLATVIGCSGDPEATKRKYVQAGDEYLKAGKVREAIIEYRNAVQVDPRFGEARLKLADAYANAGDTSNALPEYVRAADLLPDDTDAQLRAGTLLLMAGKADDALARADKVIARDSLNISAHLLRGNALAGQNDLDKALNEIEQAIKLDPARGATYTQLGFMHLALGRQEEAERALKKAIELAPSAANAHLALANFHWASGRLDAAEQGFEKALELEPASEEANRAMALLSITTGRPARAETYLKRVAESSKRPSALFALTDYYVNTGRPKDAVALLEAAQKPDTPAVRAVQPRLARAYDAAGDRAKAHAIADALIKADPRDAGAQLLKGEFEAADGRSDAALTSIKAAVASEPESIEAQFALGKLYASRGDNAAAEAAFEEVLKVNPRAAAAQVELSLLRLRAGNARGSLQAAQDAASTVPQNVEVRLALIRSLVAARDLTRAEKEITGLLAAFPGLPPALVQLGALETSRNNPVAAKAAFEKALRANPKSVEALAGLVALDLSAKDFTAAKARIEARMADGDANSALLLLAARTYGASRDFASAEKVLRRVIDTDPTLLPAYAMLGQLFMLQRRLDDARQSFDALAQKQTKPVGALTMAGIILQTQGRMPEARQRFERALAVDSRAAVAANNLAWIYAESGENLEEAVRLAEIAAQALPDMPEVQNTLGWVYYKSDLPVLAVPALARSVERDPKNPVYHYQLGLAYEKTGDVTRSRRSLTTALSLKPDFPGADNARRELARLGDRPAQ